MRRFIIALLAVVGLFAATAPSALATEGSCNPGRPNVQGNWHFGFAENKTGVWFVSADLSNYYPYYNTALTPYGTTQWIMISGPNGSYIQVGWNQSGMNWGNHVQFMEAYNATTGASLYQEQGIYMNENTMINYQIVQSSLNLSTFYLYVNNQLFWTYTFTGGNGNIMHSPVWGQVYAETQNEDAQVPGGYNSNDFVRNATIQWRGSLVNNLTGTVQDDGSWGGSTPAAGQTANGWMNLWDKACDA